MFNPLKGLGDLRSMQQQAQKMQEIEASRNDKDYVLAFNWARAKQCADEGKAKDFGGTYYNNYHQELPN